MLTATTRGPTESPLPQRRIRPDSLKIAGAVLEISTSGGYSVIHDGSYIGFLHASTGDQWNAYVRPDIPIGKFGQEECVRRIITAAGRAVGEDAA